MFVSIVGLRANIACYKMVQGVFPGVDISNETVELLEGTKVDKIGDLIDNDWTIFERENEPKGSCLAVSFAMWNGCFEESV